MKTKFKIGQEVKVNYYNLQERGRICAVVDKSKEKDYNINMKFTIGQKVRVNYYDIQQEGVICAIDETRRQFIYIVRFDIPISLPKGSCYSIGFNEEFISAVEPKVLKNVVFQYRKLSEDAREWREVAVTEEDGRYIRGYDTQRDDEFRTFLKSKIVGNVYTK